jgi:hypothetical protein
MGRPLDLSARSNSNKRSPAGSSKDGGTVVVTMDQPGCWPRPQPAAAKAWLHTCTADLAAKPWAQPHPLAGSLQRGEVAASGTRSCHIGATTQMRAQWACCHTKTGWLSPVVVQGSWLPKPARQPWPKQALTNAASSTQAGNGMFAVCRCVAAEDSTKC